MLNINFSEDLLVALKYALRGSGVIPQYVFNVIEPSIEKHAAQNVQLENETCEWKQTEDDVWETACDEAWVFEEGTPASNGMKFCAFCGRHLNSFQLSSKT